MGKEQTTAGTDRAQISLMHEEDIRFWTSELGVTMYELRDAIVATGSRAADRIRDYLRGAA